MADSSFSLTTFSPSGKLTQIEYALNAVAGGATSLGIKALDGVVLATEKKHSSDLIDEATVSKISLLTEHVGSVYSGMGPDARVLSRKARKAAATYYRTYHESVPAAQLVRETATVMQEFTQSGCGGDSNPARAVKGDAGDTQASASRGACSREQPLLCDSNSSALMSGRSDCCAALCVSSPLALAASLAAPPLSGVRPFGVSLLVAGFDDAGPQLYQASRPPVLHLFFLPSPAFSALSAAALRSLHSLVPPG
jgi:20S proteasome alpha/beta subunit